MTISIALAQAELELGKPKKNSEKAKKMIAEAAQHGADMVLLPELWSSGFDLKNCKTYSSRLGEGWFAWMQTAAADHQLAVGGSLIEEDRGSYYNTFVFYDSKGSLKGAYRKIHLFQLLREKEYLKAGKELVYFEFKSMKIGLATCYDLRFPELFRAYSSAGIELVLISAEWPEKRIRHWDLLLQARAIENQCFIAGVNKAGLSQGERLGGSSSIVNPMGEILITGSETEELLMAEIDPSEVEKIRRWMPVLLDRKAALYQRFLDDEGK